MAAAAELLQSPCEMHYLPIDQEPLLAGVREAARQRSYDIIESRREQLREADYDAVPLPVDALGSAQAVVTERQQYGFASPEAHERYNGLVLDCQRLLAEAARKNTFEYFPPLHQQLDPVSGKYVSHGFSLVGLTEAALTPVAEPEELDRRVNERVEEATYQALGRLVLERDVTVAPKRIRTISECPDWALEAFARQSKGGYGGYVPEISKFMVRDVVIDPVTGDRYQEQVGLSGKLIDEEVLRLDLSNQGIANAQKLTKTELHALQIEAPDTLLDYVARLDNLAGQKHERTVFMGEFSAQTADYESVPAAAQQRQAALEQQAFVLADNLVDLAASNIDRWAAGGIVAGMVKDILFTIAKADVRQAAVMFDQPTTDGLARVAFLRQNGLLDQAQELLQQVEVQAPAVSFCGAGSCGLENISATSSDATSMKEMGLDSSKSLRDTERRCPKCSKKAIVYDLKNKKKGCTSCKSVTGFSKKQ